MLTFKETEWTNDVGGKQDFDGGIVSYSCRYYPPNKQGPDALKPHSVLCSIWDNLMDVEIVGEEVWGDTEAEAKHKAEVWVMSRLKSVKYVEPKYPKMSAWQIALVVLIFLSIVAVAMFAVHKIEPNTDAGGIKSSSDQTIVPSSATPIPLPRKPVEYAPKTRVVTVTPPACK